VKNFKAGTYISQGSYKSFQPAFINKQLEVNNMEILTLLSDADRQLGRLDMYSEYIPNIGLFIQMHKIKEATQSSKIEGTQTNMEEAILDKENIPLNKRDDWEEVQNYIKALNSAIDNLEKIPFSSRLIREAHKTLMQGVRGEHKQPGEFRRSQNWIGGATIKDAAFIPPAFDSVQELMSDLEKFVHNEEIFVPELIKIALIHYQFETIHPFLDGNGRVGRLMITLYLVDKGILKKPILYLSDFLEKNKSTYIDNLMLAREKNDLTQWLKFFLVGIIETAKKGIDTFDGILRLQKQVEAKISTLKSRAGNAQRLINYLYQRPYLYPIRVPEILGISMASSYKLIADLEQFGILKEVTGNQRDRYYLFEDYLKLFY
jgi:Fic family protein